jgi:hypothetical protein
MNNWGQSKINSNFILEANFFLETLIKNNVLQLLIAHFPSSDYRYLNNKKKDIFYEVIRKELNKKL